MPFRARKISLWSDSMFSSGCSIPWCFLAGFSATPAQEPVMGKLAVIKAVISMGFTAKQVEQALDELAEREPPQRPTTENLVQIIIDFSEKYASNFSSHLKKKDSENYGMHLFSSRYWFGALRFPFNSESTIAASHSGASQMSTRPAGAGNPSQDSAVAPTDRLCVICFDRPAEMAFVPCGHVKTCGPCATLVADCPMCRQTIQERIRIYLWFCLQKIQPRTHQNPSKPIKAPSKPHQKRYGVCLPNSCEWNVKGREGDTLYKICRFFLRRFGTFMQKFIFSRSPGPAFLHRQSMCLWNERMGLIKVAVSDYSIEVKTSPKLKTTVEHLTIRCVGWLIDWLTFLKRKFFMAKIEIFWMFLEMTQQNFKYSLLSTIVAISFLVNIRPRDRTHPFGLIVTLDYQEHQKVFFCSLLFLLSVFRSVFDKWIG